MQVANLKLESNMKEELLEAIYGTVERLEQKVDELSASTKNAGAENVPASNDITKLDKSINAICLCVFFYPSFGGRATLELGDDAVRRRGKTGTHTDTWHGFVTIVYQHFFADGSLLQFDLDLLAGDDFC